MSFTDATALLPGLRPASFRGVGFWIIDASQTAGRRTLATYFPGTSIKTHDDFGVYDGPFRVSGLVVGDDYVAQAEALRAAFQVPGPGAFVHPWLGPKLCVVIRPAEISFASDELRVARVEVELDPAAAASFALGGFLGTLGLALGVVSRVISIARAFGAGGLSLGVVTGLAWASGLSAVARAVEIVGAATFYIAQDARAAASLFAARDALASVQGLTASAASAAQAIGLVIDHTEAAGLIWRVSPEPMTAPAAGAAPRLEPDPRKGATALLAAASAIAASALPRSGSAGIEASGPGISPSEFAALAQAPAQARAPSAEAFAFAAVEMALLGQAAATALDIPYESRQEALGWLDRLDGALGSLDRRMFALAAQSPAIASPALSEISALRAALSTDINEVAGRLPSVRVLDIASPIPAIIIAQHLAGDDPALIQPMMLDIVRRNRIRHPGRVVGRIEVLA